MIRSGAIYAGARYEYGRTEIRIETAEFRHNTGGSLPALRDNMG